MFIEMMREQEDYRLNIEGKYSFNAFALQMQCTEEEARQFISDCINEFKLFETDGTYIWSNSLLRRMEKKEAKSYKARQSAKARWDKQSDDANAMQTQCECNAIKENKVKENKNNPPIIPPKKTFGEFVQLTEDEHQRLLADFGEQDLTRMIEILDIYLGQNKKNLKRYTSHNHVLRGWVKDKFLEEQSKARASPAVRNTKEAMIDQYFAGG